jgi:N-acetylglucosaminyldiphosphoundecaprenol N-acetyl-beta-D-mannosaminyltransferase
MASQSNLDQTLTIGGIVTARLSRAQLADLMVKDVRKAEEGQLTKPRLIFYSNGSTIATFHKDPEFKKLITKADIVDADGMPLVMASRFLSTKPLAERVATTDFIHDACLAAQKAGIKFYFLGAKPGIAQKAGHKLKTLYPELEIVGIRDGYFKLEDETALCSEIVASGADVLWIGMGSPVQESFAIRNQDKLKGLSWIRCCGGLFDHMAGEKLRAPKWLQNIGFEWLFRAIQEPKRLGIRYLTTNPIAAYHLLTKTHD